VSRTPAHVITRAEMARRLGLSRASVTKACRPGGRLAAAVQGTGVNALHPTARRWLADRKARVAPLAALAAPELGATPEPHLDDPIRVDAPDPPDDDEPGEGRTGPALVAELGAWLDGGGPDLADLSEPLTTLTERYGSAPAMSGWVKCRKTLEEARKAEMLRERVAGRLIARTTVVRMIDHAAAAFRILLSDAPRTIATRLGATDMPTATALIRDVMSQHLTAAQSHMAASLEADDPMAPLMEAAE
jgi:hypothetical protein